MKASNPPPFDAKLLKIDGKKAKVVNGEQAAKLAAEIKESFFHCRKAGEKRT